MLGIDQSSSLPISGPLQGGTYAGLPVFLGLSSIVPVANVLRERFRFLIGKILT